MVPSYTITVGSECYGLSQDNDPCPVLWVSNKESFFWSEASRMTVARVRAVACVMDEKIYVMGGCDDSANWAEVFDTKTQTWETLPDPGVEIRVSKIRTIEMFHGKIYVRSNEKTDYMYDPKEGKWQKDKWHIAGKVCVRCWIENVMYGCDKNTFFWCDKKHKEWREVRGLDVLNRNPRCGLIEIVDYRGKLLILWDKFKYPSRKQKDIWCAVITLERRNNGEEVWGNIEWASVVLTVPSSYVFVRSRLTSL